MINATHYRKVATGSISFVAVGSLIGLNLPFYRLEDILISWMLFSLAFVSLALVILAGMFVFAQENAFSIGRAWQLEIFSAVGLRPFRDLLGNSHTGRSK